MAINGEKTRIQDERQLRNMTYTPTFSAIDQGGVCRPRGIPIGKKNKSRVTSWFKRLPGATNAIAKASISMNRRSDPGCSHCSWVAGRAFALAPLSQYTHADWPNLRTLPYSEVVRIFLERSNGRVDIEERCLEIHRVLGVRGPAVCVNVQVNRERAGADCRIQHFLDGVLDATNKMSLPRGRPG